MWQTPSKLCSCYRLKGESMTNDHTTASGLRRSDLARLTGCNIETIRYYENIAVIPAPRRSAKNYRIYDQRHVARLRFVMRARDLGFTLEEIRELLGLVDGKGRTCGEVQALAMRHIENIRARIADLKRIESVLCGTVSRCHGGDAPDCPVIETLTEAG